MKKLTAWELLKNNQRTNARAWLHETPIVSYGVVTKVIDAQTVEVKEKVQVSSVNIEYYTVQLLNISSGLLEIYAQPNLNDEVLIFFLRRYDPAMFEDAGERKERTGSAVITNADAAGYTRFSGVGILMKTVRASAALTLSVAGIGDNAGAHMRSSIDFSTVFTRAVSLLFDDPAADTEHAVKALFGEKSPYDEEHWAKTHRQYGMRELPDGSFAEVDAAVNEEYSVHAPVVKNIQGSQTYTVGTGKDGPTEAPVRINLDERSDITLTSKSGVTADIKKDIALTCGAGMTADIKKDVEVTANDIDFTAARPVGINDGLYKSALKPYLNAETTALTALQEAASQAAEQLGILDGLSGGAGFITGLGAAIVSFCTAMQTADTGAHGSVAKAVK
jgi:hypothetical protein